MMPICSNCQSNNIVKNSRTTGGKQKYRCTACGCYRTLNPSQRYSAERKKEILRSYHERSSLRGTHRVYGVAVTTILRWLKKKSQH